MFLGTNNNRILQDELEELYVSGMLEFYKRSDRNSFWSDVFSNFNNSHEVSIYFVNNGEFLKSLAKLEIHKFELSNIKSKYLQ